MRRLITLAVDRVGRLRLAGAAAGTCSGTNAARRPHRPSRSRFGQHHHPIRTSNAEAQKMFDQGLAQAFGFNHEAAIRSFERAAELDPSAADAALGQGVGARPELQPRYRRRAREGGVRIASRRRSRSPPPAPSTRRPTSMRLPCATPPIRKPIARRSRARSARRWAICRDGIPTISMPPSSTPKA